MLFRSIMPIILLLDRSGSMSHDGKIESMNLALKTFLDSIKNDDNNRVELQVAIYSFGDNTATCDIPLTPIDMISPNDYVASGRTPLGHAFTMVKEMIEDKNIIPSRSYKPTIVVLTDGMPTDSFEQAMIDLVNDGRSSKAFRLAMAIGDDADKELLGKFVS